MALDGTSAKVNWTVLRGPRRWVVDGSVLAVLRRWIFLSGPDGSCVPQGNVSGVTEFYEYLELFFFNEGFKLTYSVYFLLNLIFLTLRY